MIIYLFDVCCRHKPTNQATRKEQIKRREKQGVVALKEEEEEEDNSLSTVDRVYYHKSE